MCSYIWYDILFLSCSQDIIGYFEAAVAPALMLISSHWYTKFEQAPRFSLWYYGLGVGQILGGIVSYAFQQVKHQSIAGWQVMFIALGIVTVIFGIGAFHHPRHTLEYKLSNCN